MIEVDRIWLNIYRKYGLKSSRQLLNKSRGNGESIASKEQHNRWFWNAELVVKPCRTKTKSYIKRLIWDFWNILTWIWKRPWSPSKNEKWSWTISTPGYWQIDHRRSEAEKSRTKGIKFSVIYIWNSTTKTR